MPGFTYTPIDGTEIDLGQYAPGFQAEIAGRWGRHPIPGQNGEWKEDLGDGSLKTQVRLQFVGKTAPDYYTVVPALSKSRQGTLLTPRRGARSSVIISIREEVQFVERGNETTIVDVTFEDRVVGEAFSFKSGPSARAQEVVARADEADATCAELREKIFLRPNLSVRALMVTAQSLVSTATTAARTYSAAAQEAFSLGLYDPIVQAQLLAMPPQVQAATAALQAVSTAADIQDTILTMEVMLFAATQLDVAVRAAQPIPIETTITRSPGQSIYGLVQQCYGKSGKKPADIRALAGLILRLNPQIRRPSLIPQGFVVVRPAA